MNDNQNIKNVTDEETKKGEAPAFIHPAKLYSKMFNDILSGLLIALKIHNFDISRVTMSEIAEYSLVESVTIEYYFQTVKSITDEVEYTIQSLIGTVEEKVSGLSQTDTLTTLLLALQDNPVMVDVILFTDGVKFWKKHLKSIVRHITESWGIEDDSLWLEVYDAFCNQFQSTMMKWSENVYSTVSLPVIVSRLEAWLAADGEFIEQIS